jgi:D-psicose/D-tagatose/L-ribulose 3-epimerase
MSRSLSARSRSCVLAAIEFSGPVVLESFNHVHPDIASGLAVWKPVADRPDDVIDKGLPFLRETARAAGYEL